MLPGPTSTPIHTLQVQRRLYKEWHKLETAKEGTLRNRGYRCEVPTLLACRRPLPDLCVGTVASTCPPACLSS